METKKMNNWNWMYEDASIYEIAESTLGTISATEYNDKIKNSAKYTVNSETTPATIVINVLCAVEDFEELMINTNNLPGWVLEELKK